MGQLRAPFKHLRLQKLTGCKSKKGEYFLGPEARRMGFRMEDVCKYFYRLSLSLE